jgi:predicted TPR repeat methyltransferase
MLDHAALDRTSSSDTSLSDPARAEFPVELSKVNEADHDSLIGHIDRLLHSDRPAAARPLLMALKRRAPHLSRIVELEAQLLLCEGQYVAALDVLDMALAQPAPTEVDPASPYGGSTEHAVEKLRRANLHLLRGQIHVGFNDIARAIDDTAAAIMLDPAAPAAKLRLGVLLTQIGRFDEAIACLRESLNGQCVPDVFRGLATAYERSGRHTEATAALNEAIRLWPKDRELRAAAMLRAIRARDYREAVTVAETARRDGAISAEIFAMMGHALTTLGAHSEAAAAYRDALKFAPDDRVLQQVAELSATAGEGDRIAPHRVRALFELIASGFDEHIISLNYRIPGLILRALLRERERGVSFDGPALDLGCGTGLVTLTISDCTGPVTGFDISPAMLAKAREKGVFAELREGDLPDLLQQDQAFWPLIVAGDVLTYFGAIEPLFAAVRARLAVGGRFIFSIAALRPDSDGVVHGNGDWALSQVGRHVHSRAYLERALQTSGLAICAIETETLRLEAKVPVMGWIVVAGHADEVVAGHAGEVVADQAGEVVAGQANEGVVR